MKLQKYIILILVLGLVSTVISPFAEAKENENEFNVGDVIVDDQKYIEVSNYDEYINANGPVAIDLDNLTEDDQKKIIDFENKVNSNTSFRSAVPAARNKCYNKKNLKKKYYTQRISNKQLIGTATAIKGSRISGKAIAKSLGRKALAKFLGGPITSIAQGGFLIAGGGNMALGKNGFVIKGYKRHLWLKTHPRGSSVCYYDNRVTSVNRY
ncbi:MULTISPECIES: hypothetical protein [Mammaliicoccus]|uniref:Uncharacterized protein n=1 Tax=Mammaliicoccus sciuri TaxID=1296 RepID=A0AAW5LLY8_MAMSC|nr:MULTISPECIES: hypothetical protein [Mammaliicoccus]MBG9211468.1 hypothetical protein [Mammaliicoccus sciuri]MCD8846307.1 hypothetical protein [Mammaliicoccus sciuri]MCD8882485.1 hypothetical protein [Mammaliicoccus sciuri]MCQ9302718.1 hypothetical protein [Mammaliicoccus sciuri]MDO0958244.1 hypothetical protein [Mammaliicoccus sciuri]